MLNSFQVEGGKGEDVAHIINVFEGIHRALFSPGVHAALDVVEQGGEDWRKISCGVHI
jgi:hypothetical protein